MDEHSEDILPPVGLDCEIRRNLSSWCSSVPDLEMTMALDQVDVNVSPEDVQALKDVSDSAAKEFGKHPEALPAEESKAGCDKDEQVVTSTEDQQERSSILKFNASLKSLRLFLYSGPIQVVQVELIGTM